MSSYCSVIDAPQYFGDCLTDLPLTQLLLLKKSLDKMSIEEHNENVYTAAHSCNVEEENVDSNNDKAPQRMALMAAAAEERGYSSEHQHQHHHQPAAWQPPWQTSWPVKEEKPSKLQTLFQISITALAFLSFGGYLLCLIVQAIKSKGTTYFHPVATSSTQTLNTGIKGITIIRRSRRHVHHEFNRLQYLRASDKAEEEEAEEEEHTAYLGIAKQFTRRRPRQKREQNEIKPERK